MSKCRKEEVKNLLKKHGFLLLSDYHTITDRAEVKHIKCGKKFKVNLPYFLKDFHCYYCYRDTRFRKKVYSTVGNEYTFLDKYVDQYTKLRIRHNKCGHEYLTTPNAFMRGNGRCSKCNHKKFLEACRKKQGISNSEFLRRVKKMTGDEYTFLDKYVNAYTKLRVCHNKCGLEYSVTPHDFYKGSGCPRCKESKGEEFVNAYLKNNHIQCEREKTFKGLKDEKKLRFDFWIPKMNTCIEYDGIQHYKPQDWMGGVKKFNKQRKHDTMKDNFCKQHHIRLIRISYRYNTYDKVKKQLKEIL